MLGFVLGLLPGPSGVLSTFLSYRTEAKFSKYRHELGTGAPEGIAGPEAANNAAASSSLIPVLGLGIPFSVALAFMLSAMESQGITPGPLLIDDHPVIFWSVIASMYIGNVMLVILNIPLIGLG